MTIAQIAAILSLLLAFGVPQTEVDTVQGLLQAPNPIVATTTSSVAVTLPSNPQPIPQETTQPLFGATIQQTMPTVQKSLIVQMDGNAPYDVYAIYTEDGKEVVGVPITLTGDGTFTNINSKDLVTVDTATGAANDPTGVFKQTVTVNTHKVFNKIQVYVVFTPNTPNARVTASANGITSN